MNEHNLDGMRILIVEDEYLLADDLREMLEAAGATILGPVASVSEASAMIESSHRIDAALLDINLRGEMVFPVADLLQDRAVPFAFATGYDRWAIPDRFNDAVRIEKPLKGQRAATVVRALLKPSS